MDTEKIKRSITELLERAHLDFQSVSVEYREQENAFWCDVVARDLLVYSNKQSEFLGAVNHLAKRILERQMPEPSSLENRLRLVIDINGEHKRKVEAVEATAHMMAERARYFKADVEVEPMSAGDRKIVHEFLEKAEDLKTESIGDGFDRRVMIKYVGLL